jgi:hypothetical protein
MSEATSGKTDGRTRESREQKATGVPQRPRSNRAGKLNIPQQFIKPGYVPYLAINKPGNVEQMVSEGWEYIIANSTDANLLTSEDAAQGGTKFTIPAGGGFLYYGLQIRPEWYEEIQNERRQELAEAESSMRSPNASGLPTGAELYDKDANNKSFGLRSSVQDL